MSECREITQFLDSIAPPGLAEDYDNVGLMVGDPSQQIKRIMVCMDVTQAVASEAAKKKVDLIVSHHPLIFKALKKISTHDVKGKIIYELIKNNISVYAAHTNLDIAREGVNDCLAERLGLVALENLKDYRQEKLYKLVVFVPPESIDGVRDALTEAGAGWIGNYSSCTFMTPGTGTFKPLDGTNPYIGSVGKLEKVEEIRLETVVPHDRLQSVVQAMLDAHPYEEVAYDIYSLDLERSALGLGRVGMLERTVTLEEFARSVKERLGAGSVRVISHDTCKPIKRVGVFCGSFDGGLTALKAKHVDVLVTGDVKYHTAVDALEMGLSLIDAGHFPTEKVIIDSLIKRLSEKFQAINVIGSETEHDPFIAI